MPSINWYPGHMAKSRRMLVEQLRAVDAVVELVDARAPVATSNPDLRALIRGKARLLVLNKWDAVPEAERSGLRHCFPEGIPVSARTRDGLEALARAVCERVRPGPGVVASCGAVGFPDLGERAD